MSNTLLIGYGNPGRLDDGLGPALARAIEDLRLPGISVDSDYQLTVEDAAVMSGFDLVVFADAAVNGPEPFSFEPVVPVKELSFSTHQITPEAVMGLALDLFGAAPRAFTLGIRGYRFNEFCEKLSPEAARNLEHALEFMKQLARAHEADPAALAESYLKNLPQTPASLSIVNRN